MNRRKFLKIAGFTAAATSAGLVAGGSSLVSKTRKTDKPNVLFIISDDLCVALKAMDHPQCETPNLDKLAANGIRFDRTYCQWPVCGPSRASVMTGLYTAALGIASNTSSFRGTAPDIVTMPQLFKNNEYYSARVSKIYHMGIPGDILTGTNGTDDAASWDQRENVQTSEHEAAESTHADYDDVYFYETLTPGQHRGSNFQSVVVEDGSSLATELADKQAAEKALEILEARKDDPFFLAVGMVRPHVPFVVPKAVFDQYPYTDMDLFYENWDSPHAPYNEATDWADIPSVAAWEKNSVKYGDMTEQEQRKVLQGYYASVTYMDMQVGKVLDKLDELNLTDKTIIVFTSDHGYQLGQHTCWQKQSLFEDAVRVPMIISSPFHKSTAGQRCNEVIELLDVYPTVADIAGLTWPEYLQGVSLKPLLAQPDGTGWTDKVAYTVTINNGKSIRSDRYRYNSWGSDPLLKELYDHNTDPDEITNLARASNPSQEVIDALASHEALLQAKITESGIISPPAS